VSLLSALFATGLSDLTEFSKEQRAYLDASLKDNTTYNNSAEVMSALNLK
jgi:hypothetical protein